LFFLGAGLVFLVAWNLDSASCKALNNLMALSILAIRALSPDFLAAANSESKALGLTTRLVFFLAAALFFFFWTLAFFLAAFFSALLAFFKSLSAILSALLTRLSARLHFLDEEPCFLQIRSAFLFNLETRRSGLRAFFNNFLALR